jgi:biopolymer transport protein ExbD
MRPTFEERQQQRFPLSRKMPTLNHFVMFAIIVLMILWAIFLIERTQYPPVVGVWTLIAPRFYAAAYADPAGPIIVRIRRGAPSIRLSINGAELKREDFRGQLKAELSRRADWVVFVDGDEDLRVDENVAVVDAIRGLKAKVVLLTPKLKQELARSSTLKL